MAEETSTPTRTAQPTNGATESAYLAAVARGVVVFDGAMGTNIQRHHPTPEDFGGKSLEGCNDNLVLTRPDIIQSIHESFLAVGCDVVETCTFQSTPHRLREWGIGEKTRELNVAAARLARAACDKYATPEQAALRRRLDRPDGHAALEQRSGAVQHRPSRSSSENYYEQAKYLVEGGVDVLLIETAQDILEVKAAIAGFERLFAEIGRRVPVQAQVTLDTSGRMLLGTDIASAMTTLEALRVDVIGLNCSTGPEHMREPIRYLAEQRVASGVVHSERRPAAQHGHGRRGLSARAGADGRHARRVRRGVRRAHRRRLLRHDARASRGDRRPRATATRHDAATKPARAAGSVRGSRVPRASSAMRAIDFDQDPTPLLIGERVNAQGSRKVKRLLLADDYEGILDVAREQVGLGRARARRLRRAHRARRRSRADGEGREAALDDRRDADHDRLDRSRRHRSARSSAIPGRAIINSINMENGRKRIDAVVPLAKKHGAALVALTIDEIGMAKTRERKLEVAKKIYDIVVGEYGLAARGSDLRRAHVHARDRRRGVDRLGASRRSKASASSSASCRASSRSSASRT